MVDGENRIAHMCDGNAHMGAASNIEFLVYAVDELAKVTEKNTETSSDENADSKDDASESGT